MRIIIAPDSFKGSLSALQVAQAIEQGVRQVLPQAETVLVPLADGGEGTVQSLIDATGGHFVDVLATGPLGEPVPAFFGLLGDGTTAVIEMAAASGLPLIPPHQRNPLLTTTRGTGELIRAALDHIQPPAGGAARIIIGLGGSATVDGGAGMAQALGAHLLDSEGHEIGPGGQELLRLAHIDVTDLDPRLAHTDVLAACDVDNPLTGPRGAACVYGPQKGATPEMVAILDEALAHFAAVIAADLGVDVCDVPGAGAAGGLGAGLLAFLQARLSPGAQIVMDAVGLRQHLAGADLLITGEGQLDDQSVFGKTPVSAARVAQEAGVPVLAIVGGTGQDYAAVYAHGIDAVISIPVRPMSLGEAMRTAPALLTETAARAMRLLRLGQGLRRDS
ncbi:MAG: glycerate kinase [Chloroflexi bacterium]|nr:glycerate kinase [Chloroflexota bacterium]MBU1749543.1 glycerate kinase [Chloroflexota bacterium]MBU1878791.1 glycerate kinase [Chloroflexota bacterium]